MQASTEPVYRFAPEDRPVVPGGPYSPAHPALRRAGYAAIALLAGLSASFSNALVSVDIASLAGSLGAYVAEASVLPAVYVALNASTNLLLIKARIQFGVPRMIHAILIFYVLAGLAQFVVPGLTAAVVIRAASGMAATALTTLTIFNLLQALPQKARPAALVIGISLPQLGTPLARLVPVEMLAVGSLQSLHLIEIAVALAVLAANYALPLPPSERTRVIEPLDLVSVAFLAPAITLVCIVLGEGRILWWTDTPWLGWTLAAAVPLFAAAVLIELHRARPLLQIRWITSLDILRFAAVAILVRIALAEQTYGAVGLLTSGGLINDQLRILFAIVLLGMVLGIVVAVATLSVERLPYQVMVAALLIAWGAWIDSGASNLTRPEQLYFSQALLGFGTTLFIGPALLFGFIHMLARGPDFVVSLLVLFSVTQNVGGLIGSAALGTLQTAAVRAHTAALSEHLVAADPQVAARIQAQGSAALWQAATREANVLAFNDVFQLVAALATATALFVACSIAANALRGKKK